VRVFQRKKGHRFSSDDVVTAMIARDVAPDARTILDLGCGLGSVLLHMAWTHPSAQLVGVEAQDVSFALLEKNVARNDFASRVAIHHGDLRDEAIIARLGHDFDLVTGTPPYFPPSSALDAEDPQRAYARIEYRGGVEAYVHTGARLLASTGVMVLCGDSRADERVVDASEAVGLHLRERHVVIPREGRPALFSVWVLRREVGVIAEHSLVLRDEKGERTADAERVRRASGF
jgi:tRNA1(Val) A37 N6-methylase TrmN6